MTQQDVITAVREVAYYLKSNGEPLWADLMGPNSGKSQPSLSWSDSDYYVIYVNHHVKDIVIHRASASKEFQRALQNGKVQLPFLFTGSPRGFWLLPFPVFSQAFTFAILLERYIFRKDGTVFKVASGRGIVQPVKLF